MRVLVYVEGPSDKAALEVLLAPLIAAKQAESINIQFFPAPSGDRKEFVVTKVPVRAVSILQSQRRDIVVALPDLYPKNTGFPHEDPLELEAGVMARFDDFARQKRVNDRRLRERFRVFCLKHDLEALILAVPDLLQRHLGLAQLDPRWVVPVEDQDHDDPPSTIVEALFESCGGKYSGPADAPMILRGASYLDVCDACPQCFKPFVQFLQGVTVGP